MNKIEHTKSKVHDEVGLESDDSKVLELLHVHPSQHPRVGVVAPEISFCPDVTAPQQQQQQ
jgi:hypothetical protein